MATYDNRHRHHDSFSQPRQTLDPFYLDPSSRGRHEHNEHSRRSRSSHVERRDEHDDDRHPRPQRSSQRLRSNSYRSERKSSRRWPPAPSVEDEITSLRREYKPKRPRHADDPQMNGPADQEPTIIDLKPDPPAPKALGGSSGLSAGKRDARSSEAPRRPSVDTRLESLPEFSKRQPSPYSYSKDSKPRAPATSRPAGEHLLSPDSQSNRPISTRKSMSELRPGANGHLSSRVASTPSKPVFGGSDSEESDPESLRDRKPSRYSFVPSEHNRTSLRTSTRETLTSPGTRRDDKTPTPGTYQRTAGRSPEGASARRSPQPPSETSSVTSPRLGSKSPLLGDYSVHREERAVSPAMSEQSNHSAKSKLGSRPESRSDSPSVPTFAAATAASAGVATAAASNLSSHFPENRSIKHPVTVPIVGQPDHRAMLGTKRSESVKESGRQASRHDGPQPLQKNMRTSTFPSTGEVLRSPVAPLPYPVDDHLFTMPSEEAYQADPDRGMSPTSPSHHSSFSSSHRRNVSTQSTQSSNASSRPLSMDEKAHVSPTVTQSKSSASDSRSREAPKPAVPAAAAPTSPPSTKLPPCPRGEYSTKYDDWSTLAGISSSFNICPYCYQDVFARTELASNFHRSPRKAAGTRTKCDFSSPWMRLAWLLTIKRQRHDLNLLYDLASITSSEQCCPGASKASRSWYCITDEYADVISNFRICPADTRQIEALMPSLRGIFIRAPRQSANRPELCSLRTQTGRFSTYLDLLVEIDGEATSHGRWSKSTSSKAGKNGTGSHLIPAEPDIRPFVSLIRSQSYKFECPRDNLVLDTAWHFIPGLHEFTVCEECYDDVVWPDIAAGSALASRFNRSMQFVPETSSSSGAPTSTSSSSNSASSSKAGRMLEGNSCQLYSPRMRRVWRDAVVDEDEKYLARRARERKRVELELQVRMKELTRSVESGAVKGAWQDEEVREKVRRIMDTWKEYE